MKIGRGRSRALSSFSSSPSESSSSETRSAFQWDDVSGMLDEIYVMVKDYRDTIKSFPIVTDVDDISSVDECSKKAEKISLTVTDIQCYIYGYEKLEKIIVGVKRIRKSVKKEFPAEKVQS